MRLKGMFLIIKHLFFFFFNDTATTEIYTLSLHDALPIYLQGWHFMVVADRKRKEAIGDLYRRSKVKNDPPTTPPERSEEHTSELQSRLHLVCRLLLEKKKHRHR